ncbi:hypothetical protein CEP54_008549 [Fusarium duplospermum]|uniref:Metallo-beta-lactamase domain-containing protein n=1 Tax=Fusarium duplospermum TaxID=1325734 RepID=A0A428PVA9_9HYPO|nr:hypothetical protein CEP54_008549 [Fusarium duplospermum]
MASALSNPFASAAIPAFQCPPGTKLFLLNLGILRGDEGWFLRGANAYSKWGAPLTDVFSRVVYKEEHKLPNAIKACGYDIKDVKAVIFGHLHLDHAGGLEHFLGSDIPIYVHEEEFKHACWCAATGADAALYMADYLSLDKLNWKTFSEESVDLFQGITIRLAAGHTPGLCIMQVNLDKDGTFIFTTDHYHRLVPFFGNGTRVTLMS